MYSTGFKTWKTDYMFENFVLIHTYGTVYFWSKLVKIKNMSTNTIFKTRATNGASRQALDSAVVRFAGDSGDGMQVTGGQFTLSAVIAGNNLATFPDFPAEIRAPVGTTFGVSSFQINFGSSVIKTSGDDFDLLVAMNHAALFVELKGMTPGGVIIVD